MANDKKNTNELVAEDDDPTSELEALADTFDYFEQQAESENVSISELKSDLRNRSETIERLQFDIEQLRSRWTGLETEIRAREQLTDKLNDELAAALDKLNRSEKSLRKRNDDIKALKAEIRQRHDEFSALKAEVAERDNQISDLRRQLARGRSEDAEQPENAVHEHEGRLASATAEIRELRLQLERTEGYADTLRRQLQEHTSISDKAEDTRQFLQVRLDESASLVTDLQQKLAKSETDNERLRAELAAIESRHAEELRIVRFELGEAQETVAQQELVAEQLASDLVDTRGYREKLEQMLDQSEQKSHSRIDQLEKDNRRLRDDLEQMGQKLQTKSEAINCLLAELAKKSQQLESIGEIENVIHEIDDRMSERIDDAAARDKDRLSRVLIGSVDGQELRFPLFKDRLTIGRTEQNDIQLKASYISRRHAVVVTESDATRIIDWGSKNGVFVNSKRVTEHFLKNGDTVTIGTAEFRYEERPKRDG